MLKDSEHMVQEKRFYHLGVDVLVPKGTQIYAPYDGKVVNSEYEDGKGNYGNFCTLEYNVNGTKFYSLFGHLSAKSLPKLKSLIKKGGKLAQIGDYNENGD
ncbi:hypothetical protein FACS189459_1070 [Bacilli bacterium]|nr:hypothetical protein FACS189459_1070 [Bacilli bacterium]